MKFKTILNSTFFKSLLITVVFLLLNALPIIEIMNLSSYNQKFRFRGPLKPSSPIVILTIDTESIDWMSKWPWPRHYHARMVDILKSAGARLILYDVFFDSPTQFDSRDDLRFSESVRSAGNVILAASFQNTQETGEFKVVKLPFKKPIPILESAALGIGVVHPDLDRDHVVRRFQLIFKSGEDYFPSLALQAIRYLTGNHAIHIRNARELSVGQKVIPMQNAKLLINYYGPASTFESIPFGRVFDGSFLKDYPHFFENKVVLIGSSAYDLHDVFPTPFDRNLPGVEIHANVIQTILDAAYIHVLPPLFLVGILWFLVWINMKVSANLKIKIFFLVTFGEILVLYGFVFLAFKYGRLEIPTYTLTLAVMMTFLIQTVVKFIREEKEKKKVRDIFSQYVAPTVVNELLANPEMVELGGTMKEVTIFFSDIRSFTTFSENHTPKEVVELLNEYLDAMTQVIFEHGGTLDKYVGDEIMAVFGAPLPLADHAIVATRCCIAQIRKLRELQAKWKAEGKAVLDIGMGLNTGNVVVGNIGSEMHKDYTVIGDAVNLAARIEALTRKYDTPDHLVHLLISEFTYEQLNGQFECRFVDEIAVKGKTTKTKVYEVLIAEDV